MLSMQLKKLVACGIQRSICAVTNIHFMTYEVIRAVPANKLAAHFHDTNGQALPNILTSLEYGISVVDTLVSGLGGCPYALGASGNAVTEDVVYMLHGVGMETGVNLNKLISVGRYICEKLGRLSESKVNRAWKSPQPSQE